MEPEEFLKLVAGDLCPCGHDKAQHAEPRDEPILGMPETMGSCFYCECAGVIDAMAAAA